MNIKRKKFNGGSMMMFLLIIVAFESGTIFAESSIASVLQNANVLSKVNAVLERMLDSDEPYNSQSKQLPEKTILDSKTLADSKNEKALQKSPGGGFLEKEITKEYREILLSTVKNKQREEEIVCYHQRKGHYPSKYAPISSHLDKLKAWEKSRSKLKRMCKKLNESAELYKGEEELDIILNEEIELASVCSFARTGNVVAANGKPTEEIFHSKYWLRSDSWFKIKCETKRPHRPVEFWFAAEDDNSSTMSGVFSNLLKNSKKVDNLWNVNEKDWQNLEAYVYGENYRNGRNISEQALKILREREFTDFEYYLLTWEQHKYLNSEKKCCVTKSCGKKVVNQTNSLSDILNEKISSLRNNEIESRVENPRLRANESENFQPSLKIKHTKTADDLILSAQKGNYSSADLPNQRRENAVYHGLTPAESPATYFESVAPELKAANIILPLTAYKNQVAVENRKELYMFGAAEAETYLQNEKSSSSYLPSEIATVADVKVAKHDLSDAEATPELELSPPFELNEMPTNAGKALRTDREYFEGVDEVEIKFSEPAFWKDTHLYDSALEESKNSFKPLEEFFEKSPKHDKPRGNNWTEWKLEEINPSGDEKSIPNPENGQTDLIAPSRMSESDEIPITYDERFHSVSTAEYLAQSTHEKEIFPEKTVDAGSSQIPEHRGSLVNDLINDKDHKQLYELEGASKTFKTIADSPESSEAVSTKQVEPEIKDEFEPPVGLTHSIEEYPFESVENQIERTPTIEKPDWKTTLYNTEYSSVEESSESPSIQHKQVRKASKTAATSDKLRHTLPKNPSYSRSLPKLMLVPYRPTKCNRKVNGFLQAKLNNFRIALSKWSGTSNYRQLISFGKQILDWLDRYPKGYCKKQIKHIEKEMSMLIHALILRQRICGLKSNINDCKERQSHQNEMEKSYCNNNPIFV